MNSRSVPAAGFWLAFGLLCCVPGRGFGLQNPALISTGPYSGLRLFSPNSNDWWLDPSAGRLDIKVNGGVLPLATLNSLGYLGIGTTNPAQHLQLTKSQPTIRLENTVGPRTWDITIDNTGGGVFQVRDVTGATTPLVVNTSGSVGIGTTNPGQKLSVAGTVESTSGGFKFPDTSVQTTAAPGANPASSPLCMEVSFVDVAGVTSVSLTDPYSANMSSIAYQVRFDVKWIGNPVTFGLLVNGDTTQKYQTSHSSLWNNGEYSSSGCSSTALCANGMIGGWVNGNAFGAGTEVNGAIDFKTNMGNTKTIWRSQSSKDNNGSFGPAAFMGGGMYNGTPASVVFAGSTSDYNVTFTQNVSFDGHFELWRCGYKRN